MENQQMGEERLDQYLNFIKETELLKKCTSHGVGVYRETGEYGGTQLEAGPLCRSAVG